MVGVERLALSRQTATDLPDMPNLGATAFVGRGDVDAVLVDIQSDILDPHARCAAPVTSLLQQLQSLEIELHHPGVRCNRNRLEELLHPEFHEVGRSGRVYDRQSVIDHLCAQESLPTVASDDFSVVELGPDVALLTYRSAHIVHGGGRASHTLRSSLWVQAADGWRLRYHQGTAAEQEW
jgi:hypothetical protein